MLAPTLAMAVDVAQYPVLQELVKEMTEKDGYPKGELLGVLSAANIDQKTLALMDKQYESLPWHKYRNLFINDNRISQGTIFWSTHKLTLDRAYEKYGIPPEIISALIGVETHYGKRMGDKRVLDSLVTLSAAYPRRSTFFTAELRTFLNIVRKEKIEPASVLGSFAGAIGIPQFMPTSYEAYSVDFNGNGQRDLVNEFDDAIGSVANYLHVHGWKRDQKIYVEVMSSVSESGAGLISKRGKLTNTPEQLKEYSIEFNDPHNSAKVALISLNEEHRQRYVIGLKNFYAITRYNPSVNYAMAVTELSEAIRRAKDF